MALQRFIPLPSWRLLGSAVRLSCPKPARHMTLAMAHVWATARQLIAEAAPGSRACVTIKVPAYLTTTVGRGQRPPHQSGLPSPASAVQSAVPPWHSAWARLHTAHSTHHAKRCGLSIKVTKYMFLACMLHMCVPCWHAGTAAYPMLLGPQGS